SLIMMYMITMGSGSGSIVTSDPPAVSISSLFGRMELHRVSSAVQLSRADFGLSAKISRLQVEQVSGDDLSAFGLRETQVLAQSEELTVAAKPLIYPVYGGVIALDQLQPNLSRGQLLAVSGKRQRVSIGMNISGISFPDDSTRVPKPGEAFVVHAAPT